MYYMPDLRDLTGLLQEVQLIRLRLANNGKRSLDTGFITDKLDQVSSSLQLQWAHVFDGLRHPGMMQAAVCWQNVTYQAMTLSSIIKNRGLE